MKKDIVKDMKKDIVKVRVMVIQQGIQKGIALDIQMGMMKENVMPDRGDHARFPLKFRPKVLITASIVVADTKKNAAKAYGSVFVLSPSITHVGIPRHSARRQAGGISSTPSWVRRQQIRVICVIRGCFFSAASPVVFFLLLPWPTATR